MHITPGVKDRGEPAEATHRSMTGIYRIDQHGQHGWRVALQRQHRIHTRKFSDARYGGVAQALEAAQTYRDDVLAQHPGMSRRAQCAILKRNNRTGVSGVTRSVVMDRRLKTVAPTVYWVARWPGENGTATQRWFSVKRFGEWGAFLKAVEARQHGLACLEELPAQRIISSMTDAQPPRAV